MIDHVGFSVSDYARAKTFYESALTPLWLRINYGGRRRKLGNQLPASAAAASRISGSANKGRLEKPVHVAIVANDRPAVDAFYRAALAAGGKDNGAPGGLAVCRPNLYAAFVLDPDRHNIEAVCRTPA